jgi:hypothetical protein
MGQCAWDKVSSIRLTAASIQLDVMLQFSGPACACLSSTLMDLYREQFVLPTSHFSLPVSCPRSVVRLLTADTVL